MSTVSWGKGIAGIGARNTEQDTPTQKIQIPLPTLDTVSLQTHSALYGGAYPEHSQHWADFFQGGGWSKFPMGNKIPFSPVANATAVMRSAHASQSHATAGDGSGFLPLYSGIRKLALGQGR